MSVVFGVRVQGFRLQGLGFGLQCLASLNSSQDPKVEQPPGRFPGLVGEVFV